MRIDGETGSNIKTNHGSGRSTLAACRGLHRVCSWGGESDAAFPSHTGERLPRPLRHVLSGAGPAPQGRPYSDEKVANRDIRIWHFEAFWIRPSFKDHFLSRRAKP